MLNLLSDPVWVKSTTNTFVAEWFEREEDVVDQEVAVRFPDLVATSDVVEHRVASQRRAGLKSKRRRSQNSIASPNALASHERKVA